MITKVHTKKDRNNNENIHEKDRNIQQIFTSKTQKEFFKIRKFTRKKQKQTKMKNQLTERFKSTR